MLRIKFYDKKVELFELTFRNCDYQDFKHHLVSFVYKDHPYQAKFYEVTENGEETLIADHIL